MRSHRWWSLALIIAAVVAPRMAFGASIWTQLEAANPPPARFNHTMTYDPASQKLVVFGGRTGSGTLGDTWVYDLGAMAWHEVKSALSPAARFGHAAAYDPQLRRVLMFGGQASGFFNDTWAFDPIGETWQKLEVRGTPPSKRYGTSAVLDTQRHELIVSHGFTDTGRFDDTLALDFETNTWSKIQPVGDRPLKRCLHAAAYDATSDRMLLFGGCSSGFGPCPQGDLWSLDIAGRDWRELKPAGSKPAARLNPTLVSDEAGRALLFGGSTDDGPAADVWRLDPATSEWTQLTSSVDMPPARESHAAAWNPVMGQMIIFGGLGENGALNDLWTFTP
jgi:N-acetylneuraminic acid mutarotase